MYAVRFLKEYAINSYGGGMIIDLDGVLVGTDTSGALYPMEGAKEFLNDACLFFEEKLVVCTAQSDSSAKKSLFEVLGVNEMILPSMIKYGQYKNPLSQDLVDSASLLTTPRDRVVVIDDSPAAIVASLIGGFGLSIWISPEKDESKLFLTLARYNKFLPESIAELIEQKLISVPSVSEVRFSSMI
jgi:beta-phosphoglucomutase-like phosphatase (HAD superfamily)